MTPNELRLLFELAKSKGCKFVNLTYRSSESGELARHTLLFGVDYKQALERDLKYLERVYKRIGRLNYAQATDEQKLLFTAISELLDSTKNSLAKYDGNELSKAAKEKDIYNTIYPGVKQHKETGAYYLWALAHKKVVLQAGTTSTKTVNSKPLTIAKDRVRSKLRSNRYRNFRLDNVAKAAVNGNTLVIE
jgi:hypothetical protein